MGTVQELLRFLNQLDRISTGGLTICSLLLALLKLIFCSSLFTLMLLAQGGMGGGGNGATTRGTSTEAESEQHINCLELKAALFVLILFYFILFIYLFIYFIYFFSSVDNCRTLVFNCILTTPPPFLA